MKGFRELAKRPPRGFKFQLPRSVEAKLADHSHSGEQPSFEASVELGPAQFIQVKFVADLTGASLGAGYIFHLTQTGVRGHPQGGLTLVMVAV